MHVDQVTINVLGTVIAYVIGMGIGWYVRGLRPPIRPDQPLGEIRVIAVYNPETGQPMVRVVIQDALDPAKEHEWQITPAQARNAGFLLWRGASLAEGFAQRQQRH